MKKKFEEQIISLLIKDKENEISELLNQKPNYKTLKFKKKILGDEKVSILIKVINNISTITSLNLVNQQISAEVANALFKTLSTNNTITTLNLGNNIIGTKGAAIAEMLETNTALRSLHLAGISLTAKAIEEIAEVLPYNSTLIELNLVCNYIGNKGLKLLSKGLENNYGIKYLNIERISLRGVEGLAVFTEVLKHSNTTITTINLKGNNINAKGLILLSEMLENNSYVIDLKLDRAKSKEEETILNNINKLLLKDHYVEDRNDPLPAEEELVSITEIDKEDSSTWYDLPYPPRNDYSSKPENKEVNTHPLQEKKPDISMQSITIKYTIQFNSDCIYAYKEKIKALKLLNSPEAIIDNCNKLKDFGGEHAIYAYKEKIEALKQLGKTEEVIETCDALINLTTSFVNENDTSFLSGENQDFHN